METVILVKPSRLYYDDILDFREEFFRHEGHDIPGGAGLDTYDNLDKWFEKVERDLNIPIVSRVYFAKRLTDNRLLGIINLRYPYEGYVQEFGHIGYAVRPSERQKGYATILLSKVLIEARKLDIKELLITCDKDNIGSIGTIKKCGGVFQSEKLTEGKVKQRYWISLY